VAALILGEWRFPAEIIGAVREHYLLRPTDYESHLACLLNLAGWLTTQEKFGLPGERPYWNLSPRKLACLGLDEAQVRQLGVRVRNEFERLRRSL
jgi:HD-like signal output (HDOD) protein